MIGYSGICAVCHHHQIFEYQKISGGYRSNLKCENCNASQGERAAASVILNHTCNAEFASLNSLASNKGYQITIFGYNSSKFDLIAKKDNCNFLDLKLVSLDECAEALHRSNAASTSIVLFYNSAKYSDRFGELLTIVSNSLKSREKLFLFDEFPWPWQTPIIQKGQLTFESVNSDADKNLFDCLSDMNFDSECSRAESNLLHGRRHTSVISSKL